MLSSADFKKWTGIVRESTCEQMTAQFVKLVARENSSIVGQSLLAADMVHSFIFTIKDAQENMPQAMDHQKVRLIADRGRILDQCDAATLDRVNVSLRSVSNERLPKLYKECLGIMDPAEVTRYVIDTVRLEVIAAKVQSTPETHAAINEMMATKGLEAPTAVRNACATMAQTLGVAMPKRDKASENAGGKKSETAPVFDRIDAAFEAWTEDRIAGTEAGDYFRMRDDEVKAAIKIVEKIVYRLLQTDNDAAVETIVGMIADIVTQHAEDNPKQDREPLADITARMNRAKFEEATA